MFKSPEEEKRDLEGFIEANNELSLRAIRNHENIEQWHRDVFDALSECNQASLSVYYEDAYRKLLLLEGDEMIQSKSREIMLELNDKILPIVYNRKVSNSSRKSSEQPYGRRFYLNGSDICCIDIPMENKRIERLSPQEYNLLLCLVKASIRDNGASDDVLMAAGPIKGGNPEALSQAVARLKRRLKKRPNNLNNVDITRKGLNYSGYKLINPELN